MTRGAGDNSKHFGEEETPDRKLTKAERLAWAKETELAAKLLAAWMHTPKKRVLGKRQGKNGLAARCILSETMIVRGCPKYYLAILYDVARDVPGDDEKMVWRWRDDEKLDAAIGRVEQWLNNALDEPLTEIIAACRNFEDVDEEPEDIEPIPLPVGRKAPAQSPEVLAYVARRKAEQRRTYLKKNLIPICLSVIEKGNAEGATQDAKKNMRRALKEIEAYGLELKALDKHLNPTRRVQMVGWFSRCAPRCDACNS